MTLINPDNAVVDDPAPGALEWLIPFEPRRGLANGHLQTIVGNFLPRPAFRLSVVSETVEVDPADGSRVLCHCHWQPDPVRAARLTLVLVHGLEGSSDSRYIQGIASRAWDAGCNVVRMNMRTCGGTETLTPTLYHSGLSGDVGVVVRHYAGQFGLRQVALAGYSMGGNLVLKLAGELGSRPPLCAVAAVCPAIDLAPGADALHEPLNRAYEWRFLVGLLARYNRKAKLFPDIYAPRNSIGPVRSIREFDNKIVARYWGFRDADDYYHRAASARVVDRIAVPTLISAVERLMQGVRAGGKVDGRADRGYGAQEGAGCPTPRPVQAPGCLPSSSPQAPLGAGRIVRHNGAPHADIAGESGVIKRGRQRLRAATGAHIHANDIASGSPGAGGDTLDVAGVRRALEAVNQQQGEPCRSHWIGLPVAMAKHPAAIGRVHLDRLGDSRETEGRPGKEVPDNRLQVAIRQAVHRLKRDEPPRRSIGRIVNHSVVWDFQDHGNLGNTGLLPVGP